MLGDLPTWPMLVIFAVLWVAAAGQAALAMRQHGRRWWVWFLISLLCTVIPVTVVALMDYRRALRKRKDDRPPGQFRRCPHCSMHFRRDEARTVGGRRLCPHCELALDDDDFA